MLHSPTSNNWQKRLSGRCLQALLSFDSNGWQIWNSVRYLLSLQGIYATRYSYTRLWYAKENAVGTHKNRRDKPRSPPRFAAHFRESLAYAAASNRNKRCAQWISCYVYQPWQHRRKQMPTTCLRHQAKISKEIPRQNSSVFVMLSD